MRVIALLVVPISILLGSLQSSECLALGHVKAGEVLDLRIPDSLKDTGSREGYFYTPGPVTVFSYEPEQGCVVTIRDPAAPDPPVVVDEVSVGVRVFETTLPAGFYFISVTTDAGVLVGVSGTETCSGYYHYRSTGAPYGNTALNSKLYLRATGACDNKMFIFSPEGGSNGGTCCGTVCIDVCGENFNLSDPEVYYSWSPGNHYSVMNVTGNPVQVLARDDLGYFVPPYSPDDSPFSFFRTYHGENEFLNIHSFADGTEYQIQVIHTDTPTVLASGTLAKGQTFSFLGDSDPNHRVVKVRTTKGKASVSVIGGTDPADNTNYMTYVLDQNGQFQGTDFITRSHSGGFVYVTGLQNNTTVEVRDATTGALQSIQKVNEAQVANVISNNGIWRIRADKEVTVLVGKGKGGTYVPLTQNLSGTTPYPPVIAGVRWNPYFPRTSDPLFTVSFLTDELCSSNLHYKIGDGDWQQTGAASLANPTREHVHSFSIAGLNQQTVLRFRPEATDQSGSTTLDDNKGQDYVVTVHKDAPDLSVSIALVIPHDGYQTLRYGIHNLGAGKASHVKLGIELEGLQPFTDGVMSDYSAIVGNLIVAELPVPDISPNGITFVDIDVKPYLAHRGPVNYRTTTCTSSATDDFGHSYIKSHPQAVHDFDDAALEFEMVDTRYVILSNLSRFFARHPASNSVAQKMPRLMAKFALQRGAVLAYTSSPDKFQIRSYIQGRFHGKVNKSWLDAGYLLLVGCQVVMPSFRWTLDCAFTDAFQLDVSDNTYANIDEDDHYSPELIVGRITGDDADTYSALFTRALTPVSFDKALLISGTGDGEGEFSSNASDCRDLLAGRYSESTFIRLKNLQSNEKFKVYVDNSNNTDFLYYRNHGSVGGWDSFDFSSVNSMSFGNKFPIIYSNACLTGQIQSLANLADEFLRRSAAVFIGATEVSPRSANNALGKKISNYHKTGSSIGSAFRGAKRSLSGDIHWYTTCWQDQVIKREILMYNIYGDPFRGSSAVTPKAAIPVTNFDTPEENLNVSLPMYVVNTGTDGIDYVAIPDDENGGFLDAVKEPLVPTYRIIRTYEPGIRVNDIQMVSRTNESHQNGLTLPVSWWNQKVPMGPSDTPSPGVFPPDPFHWTVVERLDGGQEVMLTIHPFLYNATTKEATYYRNFSFHYQFAPSTVNIDSVSPTIRSVPIGDDQGIDVHLSNTGPADTKVNLTVEISDMGTGDVVSSQSQNGLNISSGGSLTRHFTWDPEGLPKTNYQVAARARLNTGNNDLDAGFSHFRVGKPNGKIESISLETVAPGFIRMGKTVDLGMDFRNIGDITDQISGTIQIRHVQQGNVVAEWHKKFLSVNPDNLVPFQVAWDTQGIPRGEYQMVAWAEYEGGVAGPETFSFQIEKEMRWGWDSIQDVYQHGDKIVGTGNLLHPEGGVVGLADAANLVVVRPDLTGIRPGLTQHESDPYYSTNLVINAFEPSGLYYLVTDATKAGYQYTVGGRRFVVTEKPFSMTVSPRVSVADGQSVVHVTSELVLDDGIQIPDGTLMTVIPMAGSIATPDAAPQIQGRQISSSGGRFEFDWRAPTVTSLEAFVHGTIGENQPESGV